MNAKNSDKSDRISVSLPIHVTWNDRRGKELSADARTVTISRAGAMIVLAEKIDPPQEIKIRNEKGSKATSARVLGIVGGDFQWRIYGIVFVDAAADFWEKEMLAGIAPETARPKVCLECASCSRRAIVSLNDVEDEVMNVRQLTNRLCEACGSWTVWSFADYDVSLERNADLREEKLPTAVEAPHAGVNRRKQLRIRTKASACVRYRGVKEEVVRVKDASRGGFRFISEHYYVVGSGVEVAMPYTPNAANIFVTAQIMWRREVKRLDSLEYGVAYISPRKEEAPGGAVQRYR